MDLSARMQHFDLKTTYRFQTSPGVDQYNMPLYSVQPDPSTGNTLQSPIGMYPLYQGFLGPAYINGVQVQLQTQKNHFFNYWPNIVQQSIIVAVSDGRSGPYTLAIPIVNNSSTTPLNPPIQALLRGHIDITGIMATGNNIDPPLETSFNTGIPVTSVQSGIYFTSIDTTGTNVIVQDSGQFLANNVNYGLLMQPGPAPFGNQGLGGGYSITSNTINYLTGVANVQFPVVIPAGNNIYAQCYYFQTGLPREILYYNNVLTLRNVPDRSYLVELDTYLSPAAFLNTEAAIPFGYMAEYIARGAARKILSDTGDVEQFMFYEPLFKEQELLVWKRSQRQWTNNRTETIYSQGMGMRSFGNNFGAGGNTI